MSIEELSKKDKEILFEKRLEMIWGDVKDHLREQWLGAYLCSEIEKSLTHYYEQRAKTYHKSTFLTPHAMGWSSDASPKIEAKITTAPNQPQFFDTAPIFRILLFVANAVVAKDGEKPIFLSWQANPYEPRGREPVCVISVFDEDPTPLPANGAGEFFGFSFGGKFLVIEKVIHKPNDDGPQHIQHTSFTIDKAYEEICCPENHDHETRTLEEIYRVRLFLEDILTS